MKNIYKMTAALIQYALDKDLLKAQDIIYTRNRIADYLQIDGAQITVTAAEPIQSIGQLLADISQWAARQNIIESATMPYSDLFETKLMALIVPKPSSVESDFWRRYEQSAKSATDWFFDFSKSIDYVKVNSIAQNIVWQHATAYGAMTMSINLSKPEKDPKAIAAAAKMAQSNYPKCLLCKDNIGFAGHLNHPARQTLRTIDIKLNDENWFIQYSPYAYYNEHMIAIKDEHTPMLVNGDTYRRLCDFVEYFPHYFIGSNAGLPIVGGSMLAHDHYQGGNYKMPIVDATAYRDYAYSLFDTVKTTWLNWPLTTLRLQSESRNDLILACTKLQNFWQDYSDSENSLIAHTDQPHHAITPILRKRNGLYEMDMVLRSNLTSEQYPDGIYHPHPEIHPVKRENIGLIEVMGYAILPGRLKQTCDDLARGLRDDVDFLDLPASSAGFADIYDALKRDYKGEDAAQCVRAIVADTFVKGLEHAGVIANDAAGEAKMDKFISAFKSHKG